MQVSLPDQLPDGLSVEKVYDLRGAQKRENLKGAISLASDTLKALLVLNGGAAAGLLTFYGNVVVKAVADDGGAQRLRAAFEPAYIQNALTWFAIGASAAVVASALAYWAQPKVAVQNITEQNEPKSAQQLRAVAMTVSLLSAAAFIGGVLCAGSAFR